VQGRSARYLTTVKHGEHTYAQFTPTAGGPPLMVELTEPLKALAAPLVVPSDAPAPGASKSTAAAVSAPAGAAKSTAAEVIDAELHAVMFGIEVKACVENEKYEVNGQIGTYTGAASRFGFFETTAGIVRLELTDRVKPLKGAPTTAPAQTTAQGPSTGSGPAGNPPQGAEAPKAEGSASGAAVAAAADKPKRKKKLTVDDKTESAPAAVAPEQPAVTSPPVAPEQSAQLKSPTHGLNGLPYGSMAGVHLYFGCSPIGVSTQTLGPYVDTLERELITKGQMGVHDVRVAQDSTFGFNKWKGYLADMARETPPPAGHYIVTGYADERVSVVAETLAQRAEPGAVTRGGG
jgi:hypothetical protein